LRDFLHAEGVVERPCRRFPRVRHGVSLCVPVDTPETLWRYPFHILSLVLDLANRTTSLPVELVEWPDQRGLRVALAKAGVARVLLVERGCEPPLTLAIDESWVWSDATEDEIDDCGRDMLDRLSASTPIERLDEQTWACLGLRFHLTPIGSRLFAELVASRGMAVANERLVEVGWRGGRVTPWSVESAVRRLRTQLIGTGLCVRSKRGVGFVLE